MANAAIGHFVWHELVSKDTKGAIDFYTEVIGWKTQPFGSDYVMWVGEEGPLGGVMAAPDTTTKRDAPPHWIGSVRVENADASAALAKKLGGTIHKEPSDIPTVGRYSVIADPEGAVIDLFQPSGTMARHDPQKEGAFCWSELMTKDQRGAARFYAELFGWKKIREMDMGEKGTYDVFGVGDEAFVGMMTLPEGLRSPPAWLYYTETADLDAAIARATRRRATLLNGPMDVPGGGRIAQLQDPERALFALHESARKA